MTILDLYFTVSVYIHLLTTLLFILLLMWFLGLFKVLFTENLPSHKDTPLYWHTCSVLYYMKFLSTKVISIYNFLRRWYLNKFIVDYFKLYFTLNSYTFYRNFVIKFLPIKCIYCVLLVFADFCNFLVSMVFISYFILYSFKNFLKLALLPSYVTWVLFIYFYRVHLDLELYPEKHRFNFIRSSYTYSKDAIANIAFFFNRYQEIRLKTWLESTIRSSENFFFLKAYYRLNDLLWQDGFLIDFLQKKIVDRWVRTFVIYSGYLFNERLVFDIVIRLYIDFVIWPTYSLSIYEFKSISSTLTITLFLLILIFILIPLVYFTPFF